MRVLGSSIRFRIRVRFLFDLYTYFLISLKCRSNYIIRLLAGKGKGMWFCTLGRNLGQGQGQGQGEVQGQGQGHGHAGSRLGSG